MSADNRTGAHGQPRAPAPAPRPPQLLTAVVIPAERGRPVRSVLVEASTRAYSDLLGGGLLEEVLAVLPEGGAVALYLDERRVQRGLSVNPRAHRVATRLGLSPPFLGTVRGDILITGLDHGGADTDVPSEVASVARRSPRQSRFRTR